ncbi:hypothetical protein SGLAM104S_05571 [Streptomyces glaucescens]
MPGARRLPHTPAVLPAGTTSATDGRNTVARALELHNYVGHLIRRAEQVHTALWYRHVSRDITSQQFAVLNALSRDPGIDQRTLARHTSLDRSTVNHMVRRLTDQGYVTQVRDEEPPAHPAEPHGRGSPACSTRSSAQPNRSTSSFSARCPGTSGSTPWTSSARSLRWTTSCGRTVHEDGWRSRPPASPSPAARTLLDTLAGRPARAAGKSTTVTSPKPRRSRSAPTWTATTWRDRSRRVRGRPGSSSRPPCAARSPANRRLAGQPSRRRTSEHRPSAAPATTPSAGRSPPWPARRPRRRRRESHHAGRRPPPAAQPTGRPPRGPPGGPPRLMPDPLREGLPLPGRQPPGWPGGSSTPARGADAAVSRLGPSHSHSSRMVASSWRSPSWWSRTARMSRRRVSGTGSSSAW